MRAVIFLYETLDIEPLNFKKNYVSSIIQNPMRLCTIIYIVA